MVFISCQSLNSLPFLHWWVLLPWWQLPFYGVQNLILCPLLQCHLFSLLGWAGLSSFLPTPSFHLPPAVQDPKLCSLLGALSLTLTGRFWSFPNQHVLPQSPHCNWQTQAYVPLPLCQLQYGQSHLTTERSTPSGLKTLILLYFLNFFLSFGQYSHQSYWILLMCLSRYFSSQFNAGSHHIIPKLLP